MSSLTVGPRLRAGSRARHRGGGHRGLRIQIGRGDEQAPTRPPSTPCAAPSTMLPIDGTVVIGEGERDEAPMLYIGEKVGNGGVAVDIALDPLEGTTLTAKAMANALAVMAWPSRARCSTRPTPTWTRSPSAPAIRTASSISTPSPADNVHAARQGQGRGAARDHRLRARPAAPRRDHRHGAQGRRRRST